MKIIPNFLLKRKGSFLDYQAPSPSRGEGQGEGHRDGGEKGDFQ
jgi:hypothetical protein